MRFRSLVAAALLTAVAVAQSITIPNGTGTTEGTTVNLFPWGRAAAGGLKIQCIYDSSHFTLQGVSTPVQVNRLRWRANGAASSWSGGSYTSATVKMSTSPTDANTPSATFAANEGANVQTVYTGAVTFLAGSATTGTLGPTVVDLTLTTPFVYDPNLGDLNIDVDFAPGSWVGGTVTSLDVQGTGANASRVYASATYGAATGTIGTQHGVVVTLDFSPVGGSFATASNYGNGCYTRSASLYETFATSAAFDLANSAISLVRGANGYVALPGFTTYVPPSATATVLGLLDDSEATVPLSAPFPIAGGVTSALTVCSNGFVSVATGNGTSFTPDPAVMLAAPQTGWWCWHDYNPSAAGSGAVKFEEIGGTAYVTWDGVFDFGGTTVASANTFQMQFETATGNVHMVFGAMSTAGNARVIGFSPGGASIDPGSTDLSTALAPGINLGDVDVNALRLTASLRPITGTTMPIVTSNIPAGSPLASLILSFTQVNPGLDLGFLGAPGCAQYVGTGPSILFIAPIGSATLNFVIPNVPAFVGQNLFGQSVTITPGANLLGIQTSNGVALVVGSV